MKNVLRVIFSTGFCLMLSQGVHAKCVGYAGPGGPCYTGPGGGLYTGPGGGAYAGPGGLATQALVVKTLTLGIDPTQTVGRSVVCREF